MLPQGDYDPSKTKVLHLTVNPASEARLSLRQDRARLQAECERLREALGSLERGGPVPAGLESVFVPSSKEVAGRAPRRAGGVCVSLCPSCAGRASRGLCGGSRAEASGRNPVRPKN